MPLAAALPSRPVTRLLSLCLALLVLTPALHARADELEAQEPGRFSRVARRIWDDRTPPQHVAFITAPDRKKAIVIAPPRAPGGEARHEVRVRIGTREFATEIGAWINAEAAWSRDSRAFFVTYSDGTDDATYHVVVFQVAAGGLRVSEPVKDGRALFQPACAEPDLPNVVGMGWPGRDAGRLLVAVAVPRGASCGAPRTFRAFELALPAARVRERYDQLQAKREFPELLGQALAEAPDECVRNPSACPARKR